MLLTIIAHYCGQMFTLKCAIIPRCCDQIFALHASLAYIRRRADNGSHFMTNESHVTHQSVDPWPACSVTYDPWLSTTHQSLSQLTFAYLMERVGSIDAISISYCAYGHPSRWLINTNKFSSHQLIFLPKNVKRIWAFPRKSVPFRSCLLISGRAVTEIVKMY